MARIYTREYKVATVSTNTNTFGLRCFYFVGRNGDTWQALGNHTLWERYAKGTVHRIPNSIDTDWFTGHGFECPQRVGTAPRSVAREVWQGGV